MIRPEQVAPTTWTLEYRIPIAMLEDYCNVTAPAPGVTWRANFFKCAGWTTQPHWLTWSPVPQNRKPNFHLPACFGTLEFTN